MRAFGVRGRRGGWPQHRYREDDPAAGDGRGDAECKAVAAGQRRRCGLPAGEEDVRARRGERGQDGEAECAPKLCSGGFTDFGVRRVVAETLAGNLGSRRVLEKSGLIQVDAFPGGGPDAADRTGQGHVVYELTRAGWEARHRTVS